MSLPAVAGLALAVQTLAACSTAPPPATLHCEDAPESIYEAPTPEALAKAERGAILRCAPLLTLTRDELDARLRQVRQDFVVPEGYAGQTLTSGVKVLRLQVRTERAGPGSPPGYTSAIAILPDVPAADQVPLVIAAHGSRGQATACAPSRLRTEGDRVRGDFELLAFPFAGLGFPVIASDGAGYAGYGAPGNPPSAYSNSEDIAKSLLDSGRALSRILGAQHDGQVVLTGHSQGGHSALSALALSTTYGTGGRVAAVATYAPLWFSQRSWAAIFAIEREHGLSKSQLLPVSIWYHYTTGELLDGPGGGLAMFRPDRREAIKRFVDTTCWGPPYTELQDLGEYASDFFDPAFIDAVRDAAAFGSPCPEAPSEAAATCAKWLARYVADRPALTGEAANVPILIARGGLDGLIPADRLRCAVDHLSKNTRVPLTYCADPAADHGGVLRTQADAVVDWVASTTLGRARMKACPSTDVGFVDDAGAPVSCPVVPPNN